MVDQPADGFRVVAQDDVPPRTADAAKFVGEVGQAEVLPALQDGGMRGHRFVYAPGARSNWHVHTGEQALIVVSGRGLVQWEGLDEPRPVAAGDWVHVRPGIPHWHGAAPDSEFTHLAVTATGGTTWREAVTDAEYEPRASTDSTTKEVSSSRSAPR